MIELLGWEEIEPCPCCGAERENPYICSVCGWDSTEQEEVALWEAKLNFQTFGCIDPMQLMGE